MRHSARDLIQWTEWPGDNASPIELAELGLLRALWLQKETHRAVRYRQSEAASILARSAVENCIVTLWFFFAKDPIELLREDNCNAFIRLFKFLEDFGFPTQGFVEIMKQEFGGSGKLPSIFEMAETVSNGINHDGTVVLYRRLYVPLSTFYTHTNGLGLLRHVNAHGKPKLHASSIWTCLSALRTVDGCVGIIAGEIAVQSDKTPNDFFSYAEKHLKRSLNPVFVMAGRHAGKTIHWSRLSGSISGMRKLRKYLSSKQRREDSRETQERITKALFSEIMQIFEVSVGPKTREYLMDEFVNLLLKEELVP